MTETLASYEQALIELSQFYDGKIEQLILRKVELESSLIGTILNAEYLKENLEMDNTYVRDVVNGVLENIESIDKVISKYLENWDLDRLGKTDKAILRLGAYELIHYDTPKVVVINEAVELAKKYSDDKVVKLINAVLDKIRDNEEVNEKSFTR